MVPEYLIWTGSVSFQIAFWVVYLFYMLQIL